MKMTMVFYEDYFVNIRQFYSHEGFCRFGNLLLYSGIWDRIVNPSLLMIITRDHYVQINSSPHSSGSSLLISTFVILVGCLAPHSSSYYLLIPTFIMLVCF